LSRELVPVALAKDRFEAEMIEGLLAGGGIPSLVEDVGISAPGFGVGGLYPPRNRAQVMLHADRFEEARTLLTDVLVADEDAEWPQIGGPIEDARGRSRKGLLGRLFGGRE
jgi:Putative prokaryotic signal transducing protein